MLRNCRTTKICLSTSLFPVDVSDPRPVQNCRTLLGFAQGSNESKKVELCQGPGRSLKAGCCLQSLRNPVAKLSVLASSVAALRVAQKCTLLKKRRGQERGRRNWSVFLRGAHCA